MACLARRIGRTLLRYSSGAVGIILEAFARVVAENRRKIAIHAPSEDLNRTFGDLESDIADFRTALSKLGLPERPTIVSNVGNHSGFVPLFVAGLASGGAFLSVDGDAPAAELLDLADTYGADLVVVRRGIGGFDHLQPTPLPCGLAGSVRRIESPPAWRSSDEAGEADALLLRLTSGSTRASKVVIASEHNVFCDGRHIMEGMEIRPGDVGLATIPLAHAYGMGNLVMPLLLQGTTLVLRDSFLPAQWTADMTAFGITVFPSVPFIFDCLRRMGDAAAPIRQVRLCVTAGAPIDIQTLQHFKQQLGVKIHSLYGTSETGSITFDSSETVGDTVSVGWPLPETAVSLVSIDGIDGTDGPEGRIKVQGTGVARRYAHDSPVSDRLSEFTGDGFLTADLGTFGLDGQLHLLGRVSGFINVAGRKVHPGEVERVIFELPGVAHVSVFGVDRGVRGEELVACVHRRSPEITGTQIRAHCAAVLSPYKVPKRVIFGEELPVTGRGKVDRKALEALLRSGEE
jgi:acyl-coenzyme A synthetase/AMP-(fatty) acid ligase